ncbi:MAG: AraC family ligand binding domain-containing protein, partial [Lachnospiraceae bacterium]|nr:AraC family ligand binding domain-containing protein [Lachnospiraceae bacterium]
MSTENLKNIDNYKEIYEHVNNDYPLGVYFVKPDEYFLNNIPWHWHDEIEIDVVREGNAIYTIGEDIIRVPANNLIVIKGNVVHSIKSENGNCSIISVIFSPAVLFADNNSSLYQSYFM